MEIDRRTKEMISTTPGVLLVITGKAGAGKDTIFQNLLSNEGMQEHGFSRVVTHATRKPRKGEEDGVDYHFISEKEMFDMHERGELVEEPVKYGTSYKATSKEELMKVMAGQNKIWRVEANLAGNIASGEFFNEFDFDKETMMSRTIVVFIHADDEAIEQRRMQRDGEEGYDPEEYRLRDAQDVQAMAKYSKHFTNKINNPDGENNSLEEILDLIDVKLSD